MKDLSSIRIQKDTQERLSKLAKECDWFVEIVRKDIFISSYDICADCLERLVDKELERREGGDNGQEART